MAGRRQDDESNYDQGESKGISLMPRVPQHILRGMTESCLMHSVGAGFGGVAMGIGMGVFVATFSAGHGELIGSGMAQQLKHGFLGFWKQAVKRGFESGKTFGVIGVMFAGSQCQIAKMRGTHDYYNGVIAGVGTGTTLGVWQNKHLPRWAMARGALVGGLAFGAFSLAIEYAMDEWLADMMP